MTHPYSRNVQRSVLFSGLIAILAIGGALFSYRRAVRANQRAISDVTSRLVLSHEIQHLVELMYSSSRSFVLVRDESFARDMERSRGELLRALGRLAGTDERYQDEITKIESIESRLHDLHRKAHDLRRSGRRAQEVGLHMVAHVQPVRETLDEHVRNLVRLSDVQLREASDDARANVVYARSVSLGAALAVVLTFLIVLWLVSGFTKAQIVSEQAVRELNASLETRVAERTRDLLASNRELEAFSYAVAHDLRTPLRAISNYGEMVMTQLRDHPDKRVTERLDRMRAAGVRMSDLIDGLLALSRLTRRTYTPEPVDISGLASEVARETGEAFPERIVRVSVAPGLRDVGDASMLRVLLKNLFENAWKFTAKVPAPTVEFGRTSVDGDPAYFVRDNGVGFDPRFQRQILMPFERLHDIREYPGSGIGLPTADRVVRKHGGSLWAEGKVNEGATFYFTLNRRVPAKERLMTPENFRDT